MKEPVISHNIPPVDLLARLEKAEAILDALGRQEADAIMGSDGLMFVRSKDVLERECQARQVLEEMVVQRTKQLQQANDRLTEDINKRQLLEQALVSSEERARELAELSSDWFWEQDEHFRFTSFSADAIEKTDALSAVLLGMTRWESLSGANAPDRLAHCARLEARQSFKGFEYRVENKIEYDKQGDCQAIEWVSVSGKPLFDANGDFKGYRGTGRNITKRKQAEQALRVSELSLHQLTGHLQQVREDERKRIARDIHDDLGQNLMVLRIDMARMASSPDSVAFPREGIAAALRRVDTTIKAVRAIINDLRPPTLDLGLHAALEWQATEFTQRTGIACQLQIDHDEFALDDQRATALFRIVQEALCNIVRHAKASRVQIVMERTEGHLILKITDDGIGLAAGSLKKANTFGLLGIEERIDSLGGTFSIVSHPGQGMAILLSIPL